MWTNYSDFYILDPFPDELLYSTLSRTYRLLSFKHSHEVGKKFHCYHSKSPLSTVPFYHFQKPLEAFEHSIVPYYMAVYQLERQKKALVSFLTEHSGRSHFAFNRVIEFSPFEKPFLSYCPLCLLSDLETFGMPYFHLSHQYEGITACSVHGTRLLSYSFEHDYRSFPLLKPDDYVKPEPVPEREHKYSKWAVEFKNFSHEYLKAVYHSKILEIDPKLRNVNYLFETLESFFGIEFLEKVDCLKEGLTRGRKKISGLLTFCTHPTHPFYHFMLWELLGLTPDDFKDPVYVIRGKSGYYPVSDPVSNLNSTILEEDLGMRIHNVKGLPKKVFEYFPLDLNNYLNIIKR